MQSSSLVMLMGHRCVLFTAAKSLEERFNHISGKILLNRPFHFHLRHYLSFFKKKRCSWGKVLNVLAHWRYQPDVYRRKKSTYLRIARTVILVEKYRAVMGRWRKIRILTQSTDFQILFGAVKYVSCA